MPLQSRPHYKHRPALWPLAASQGSAGDMLHSGLWNGCMHVQPAHHLMQQSWLAACMAVCMPTTCNTHDARQATPDGALCRAGHPDGALRKAGHPRWRTLQGRPPQMAHSAGQATPDGALCRAGHPDGALRKAGHPDGALRKAGHPDGALRRAARASATGPQTRQGTGHPPPHTHTHTPATTRTRCLPPEDRAALPRFPSRGIKADEWVQGPGRGLQLVPKGLLEGEQYVPVQRGGGPGEDGGGALPLPSRPSWQVVETHGKLHVGDLGPAGGGQACAHVEPGSGSRGGS
jgi:hypothetical protein